MTDWQEPVAVHAPPCAVPVYVIGELPEVVMVMLPSKKTVPTTVRTRVVAFHESWPCEV